MLHSAGALRLLMQLWLVFACLLGTAPAWSEDLPEYRLKAAFLYNFVSFTEWPADVGATINLCIYGADPFLAEIDPLDGKSVGSRKIELLRKKSIEGLKGCHVVFVADSAFTQMPRVVEAVRDMPVLIVADTPGAVREGAMLNMNLAHGRVNIEANVVAARNARLTISSKLLRLATEVIQ